MPKRKVQLNAGDLILNSPFREPSRYWSYDRKHRVFTEIHGRRPAGYVVATPNAQGCDDPGQFIELDLVNKIRPKIQAWREANYPHVTGITCGLLEHGNDPDQREGRRFFFCQMEAIETLIWLTEAAPAERSGIEFQIVPTGLGDLSQPESQRVSGPRVIPWLADRHSLWYDL